MARECTLSYLLHLHGCLWTAEVLNPSPEPGHGTALVSSGAGTNNEGTVFSHPSVLFTVNLPCSLAEFSLRASTLLCIRCFSASMSETMHFFAVRCP